MANSRTFILSSLLAMGCGNNSSTQGCTTDSDCPTEQVCLDSTCTPLTTPTLDELVLETGFTDQTGHLIIHNHAITVIEADTNKPISNAKVFSLTNGPKTDLIIMPESRSQEYLPAFHHIDTSSNQAEQNLAEKINVTTQNLGAEIVIALEAASIVGKLYNKSKDLPQGTLLSEDRYTRQVCMTRSDIEASITHPITGIFEITGINDNADVAQFFGYFDSFKTLFFDILVPEFNQYEEAKGFIVTLPKHQTALDILSERPSNEIIYTDLSTLQHEMETMPYWRITGTCNPEENPKCTFTAGKRCEGDTLIHQNACGEKQTLQNCQESSRSCSVGSCRDGENTLACAQEEADNSRYCSSNGFFLYARDKCGNDIFIKDCEEQRDNSGRPYRCQDGACQARNVGCDGEETRVCEDISTILYTNSCGEPTRIDCDDNEQCRNGQCIEDQINPEVEVLNGRDDDNDGQIDEGFVGTGDPQITLYWEGNYDLDLRVTGPDECKIWYFNPICDQGQLDRDARRECFDSSVAPPENIYWPNGTAPAGQYLVEVARFDRGDCRSPVPIEFTVAISNNGIVTEYEKTLEPELSVMEVTKFRH